EPGDAVGGFHRAMMGISASADNGQLAKSEVAGPATRRSRMAVQERWPSGLRRTLGKRVYVNSVPWVRIPLSPPTPQKKTPGGFRTLGVEPSRVGHAMEEDASRPEYGSNLTRPLRLALFRCRTIGGGGPPRIAVW